MAEKEPLVGPREAALANLVAPGLGLALQRRAIGGVFLGAAAVAAFLSGLYGFEVLSAFGVLGVGSAAVSWWIGRPATSRRDRD